MKPLILLLALLPLTAIAAQDLATLRAGAIEVEKDPPRLANVENRDLKRKRNYPMQPPTIPHQITDYHIDLNSNKCLSCHSRRRTEESQAPMVSVTHFMDRDGNFLADVSPRRYFCNQCHVEQTDARPLVENTFQDVDALLKNKTQEQ